MGSPAEKKTFVLIYSNRLNCIIIFSVEKNNLCDFGFTSRNRFHSIFLKLEIASDSDWRASNICRHLLYDWCCQIICAYGNNMQKIMSGWLGLLLKKTYLSKICFRSGIFLSTAYLLTHSFKTVLYNVHLSLISFLR